MCYFVETGNTIVLHSSGKASYPLNIYSYTTQFILLHFQSPVALVISFRVVGYPFIFLLRTKVICKRRDKGKMKTLILRNMFLQKERERETESERESKCKTNTGYWQWLLSLTNFWIPTIDYLTYCQNFVLFMSSDSALDNSNSVFQKNEKIFMNIQGCYHFIYKHYFTRLHQYYS